MGNVTHDHLGGERSIDQPPNAELHTCRCEMEKVQLATQKCDGSGLTVDSIDHLATFGKSANCPQLTAGYEQKAK